MPLSLSSHLLKFLGRFLLTTLFAGGAVLTTCAYSQEESKDSESSQTFALQSLSSDASRGEYEKKVLDVSFLDAEGTVKSRPVVLFLPKVRTTPAPLIFVPHYEIAEQSGELKQYLAEGWITASPMTVEGVYNGMLTDDDLVFNSAALYTLRNMDAVDKTRIALVGGSAGGYSTLMLNALHMGICSSIANSPITNVYFNFYQFFQESQKYNIPEKKKAGWKNPNAEHPALKPFYTLAADLPMPVLSLIVDSFLPILKNFPDPNDVKRWEAFSPVALAGNFDSPIVVNHSTSDILVPIEQITRKFTYAENGSTMPEGIDLRLPKTNPGLLGRALDEELPAEQTTLYCEKIEDPDRNRIMAFDADKLFTINISDDGAPEGYGSHKAISGKGGVDQLPYLRETIARSASKTEILASGKLVLLLARYQGKSVQLPAHVSEKNEEVYGSLRVYQREVVDELALWAQTHSFNQLEEAVEKAIDQLDNAERTSYADAWKAIKEQLSDR